MKWFLCVIVFVYLAYRAVYGAIPSYDITVDKIDYGNGTFLQTGTRKTINCRASNRLQRLEWVDQFGSVIKRVPMNRVFTQELFVKTKGRAPALVLTFTDLQVKDTGLYQCRSGNNVQEASLCVLTPLEFITTKTEEVALQGRSITLSCQAKGDPEPSLIWVRNMAEITEEVNATKYKIFTKFNREGFESLLTITSLEPEDRGVYGCLAEQIHPALSDCEYGAVLNITLQVNYAPVFEKVNVTKAVYGKNNDIVDLVCSANGYPAPTYRWFKAVDEDTLAEFDKNQIKLSEEENQAVLPVTASPTTFGQTYKCVASNSHGEAEKYFQLHKIQKPLRPSMGKPESAYNHIKFNVTWEEGIDFPIDGFQIQYLKSKRKPTKEIEWQKATKTYEAVDEDLYDETYGIPVAINDLEEDTVYWVRIKATNALGESSWAEVSKTRTEVKTIDEDTAAEMTEKTNQPKAAEGLSNSIIYGIFFACCIIVIVILNVFFIKLV